MGKELARSTGALLNELAKDCDRIQAVIGELLNKSVTNDSACESFLDPGALQDLQGLDRISQLLRDVAAVQQALSQTGAFRHETAPKAIEAAKLEETRRALGGRGQDPDNPISSSETGPGECTLF